MALPNDPHAGLMYWRLKKKSLSTTPIENLEWVNVDENFDPYNIPPMNFLLTMMDC